MITVVYVDDEPDLLEITRLFLERSGEIRLITFVSPQEALDSPAIRTCDAIISDYQMPGMDGIALLKEVKNQFGDIPFILFTGRGREEVVIEAINNGADFYLQKGGDPAAQFAELAHKVRQAVRRKEAERSLYDSERRLADIIDFLPDAMMAVDRSGHVIAWNRAIEDITGVPASAILGKGDYEYSLPLYGKRRPLLLDMIFMPDEKIREYYSGVIHDGNAVVAESMTSTLKGNQLHIMVRASPLYNQKGEITGAIQIFRDITQLKKNEHDLRVAYEQVAATEEELRSQYDKLQVTNEQLREAKEELFLQVENLAKSKELLRKNGERLAMAQSLGRFGSWEYAVETDTFWTSAEGARILGYPAVAGEMPVEKIDACIQDPDLIRQAMAGLITEGKAYNLEYAIIPADNSGLKIVHSVARLERDAEGHPLRVIGIVRDVTEQRKADEEIAFKNTLLSTQQETSPDGILTVDENGKIISYNQKFTEIWNIQGELIAQGMAEPVLREVTTHLLDPGPFLARIQYLYEHRDEKSFDELLLRDGRILEWFSAPVFGGNKKYYGRVWYFRDITERRQINEDFRKLGNTCSALYTNMLEGAALHKLVYNDKGEPVDYVILETNPAFEHHLGISRESVRGKTSREAYGVSEPPYLDIYARVAITGEPESFETYFPPMKKYFAISAYSPEKGRFATIFEDITKRKRTEAELRESEEKFRLFIRHAPAALAMFDHDMHYLAVSQRWITDFHLEGQEILGRSHYEIFPEIPDSLKEVHRRGLSGEVLTGSEDQFVRTDGTVQWISWEMHPWFTADQEIGGIIIFSENVTGRKRAEVDLRESENKFRALVETSPDMIWEIDPAGKFQYISPMVETILGYTPDTIVGKMITDLVMEDKQQAAVRELERILSSDPPLPPFEISARHRDGHEIIIGIRASRVIDSEGKLTGFRGVASDITERRRTEKAVLMANRQLNLLGSVTRHDALNKITVILGYLRIASMKCSDPAIADLLKKMESALAVMRSQIEFTRIYQNLGSQEPQWIDLDTLLPSLQVPASITSTFDLQGVRVLADAMIEKVFTNLLDNSIRHGERVTEIRVTSHREGTGLVIVWEDNGVGIPVEEKEQIFVRGFGKHTGLGLFLVREILSLTGIAIRETGIPGSGARFEILVPEGVYRLSGTP